MPVDISTIQAAVDKAYPAYFNAYTAQEHTYESFCDVQPVAGTNQYGEKATAMQGVGDFRERDDGEDIESDHPGQGPTWQLKIRQLDRDIPIPGRALDSMAAVGHLQNWLMSMAESFAQRSWQWKEDFVAQMLNDGFLTAGGRTQYWDNSFLDNADVNKGFGYDGLPLFDTVHTLTGSTRTFNNIQAAAFGLSVANLETVITEIAGKNCFGERGERIQNRSDYLMVAANLGMQAERVLMSELDADDASNSINPVRGKLSLIVNHSLEDGQWFVGRRGEAIRVRDSGVPVLRAWHHEKSDTTFLRAGFRFGAAPKDVRFIYGCGKDAA